MNQTRTLTKAESSVLDIGLNWAEWLGSDVITLSEWTADPEITISNRQANATSTSCYISGGLQGMTYRVYNKITTNKGLIDSRFITISVRDVSV